MSGSHASDGFGELELAPPTGPESFPVVRDPMDGATFPIPVKPGEVTAPFTPDWTQPQRAVAVVTVSRPTAPAFPAHRRTEGCGCKFCQPPSTPPRHPYAVWDTIRDVTYTATPKPGEEEGRAVSEIGIQRCADCKTVYTDESARSSDRLILDTERAAVLAGWKGDGKHGWRCPDCHAKYESELAAQPRFPGNGPGTEAYETWILSHIECLSLGVLEEVELRAGEFRHYYPEMSEDDAIGQAAAVVAERRAVAA